MMDERGEEDSECIVPFLESGAIPLVRGNVP
jgi:Asp-tRNA(Asn)/Glu-tRNA(Gln) amidotransferase A subunit family amidase